VCRNYGVQWFLLPKESPLKTAAEFIQSSSQRQQLCLICTLNKSCNLAFGLAPNFFIWATMLYGIEIKVHFFTSHKQMSEQSSLNFLRTYLPDSPFNRVSFPEAVNVFFFANTKG
jgi:hypothetical protein